MANLTAGPVEKTFAATGASDTLFIAIPGWFDVSVNGTFAATVKLQRSYNGTGPSATWRDVYEFSSAEEKVGWAGSAAHYRFYCSAYTSGSPDCVLKKA